MSSKPKHRSRRSSSGKSWSEWEWSAEHEQYRRYRINSKGEKVWDYELGSGDATAPIIDTPRYVPATTADGGDLPPIHEDEQTHYDYGTADGGNWPQEGAQDHYEYNTEAAGAYEAGHEEGDQEYYQDPQNTQSSQIEGSARANYYEGEGDDLSGAIDQMRLKDEEDAVDSSDEEDDKPKPRPKPEPAPGPAPKCNHHGCINGSNRDPDGPEPRPPPSGYRPEVKRNSRHQSGGSKRSKEASSDKSGSRSGGRKRNEQTTDQENSITNSEVQAEYQKWEQEWETWKDATCFCGHGYYTIEGQWISGQAVRDGLAPPKPLNPFESKVNSSIGVQ